MNWEGYIKAKHFTKMVIYEGHYQLNEVIRDKNGTHTMSKPLSDVDALDTIEKWVRKHDDEL